MSNTPSFFFKNKPEIIWQDAINAGINAANNWLVNTTRDIDINDWWKDPPKQRTMCLTLLKNWKSQGQPFIDYLHNNNIGKFIPADGPMRVVYVVEHRDIIPKDHLCFGMEYSELRVTVKDAVVEKIMEYGVCECE